MPKKETPTDIIEGESVPEFENFYIKYPGENPIDVTGDRERKGCEPDKEKIARILEEHGGRKYTTIHTHPYSDMTTVFGELYPRPLRASPDDFIYFLKDKDAKCMKIAHRERRTGKVSGYLDVRKTKRTPDFSNLREENLKMINLRSALTDYESGVGVYFEGEKCLDALDNLCKEYNLKFKYTPKKGNRFEYKDGLGVGFRSLEKKVAGIISVFSLVGAILLFSGNLTGSVVGNLANSTANVVGASLIIVGLMAGYFLIRK